MGNDISMTKYNFKDIDLVNLLFISLTPIIAALLFYSWVKIDGFNYGQLLMGIVFYFITGISITAGYHRLFAHKAYSANPVIKFLFLIFGAAAFQNSVLKWASDHRVHHQKVDTENDPYSIQEGFMYAHMGWIILKKNSDIKEQYAKDFMKDKMVVWQHKYYLLISSIVGLLLPALLGELFFNSWLGGLAVAGFSRVVMVHHCTFFINSLCHCIGTTPYTDTNSAKDSWIMALFTFGEGYHNFHHFFQADYRNGIKWYHFDPTKWLINFLRMTGLAFKLKLTPQEKILAARMQMKVKELKNQISANEKFNQEVELLKVRVFEALRNFQELKTEYKATKAREIKERMILAKRDFHNTLEAWNLYINFLNVYPAQKLY
jgi:stearoyl-CoA desaturase (delta-9 desaturase)